MDGHKRKRDEDGTVVTFYTPDRTFQRVYKGQSLEETKTLVRTKLGLPEDASIRFSRLHEGRHIDLEDDDDFEAFRHLARYVTTLDVSVFVENGGPPIFSQQPPANATQPISRKRSRKLRVEPRLSSAFSDPASGRSTPTSATIPRPPASTLDANGVPQKKRKRREETRLHDEEASSTQPQPASATESSRAGPSARQENEAGPSKTSKKKSRKDHKSSGAVPETQVPAPHSSESPAPAVGSKRKRLASPEPPRDTTDEIAPPPPDLSTAPRSPSPSSPIRKKRKKEKRSQLANETTASADDSQPLAHKSDKKGKWKADAAANLEPSTLYALEVTEPHGGETADTEDNVATDKAGRKAKKDKKGAKDKKKRKDVSESDDTPSPDVQQASVPSEESSKEKRKRKRRETEVADDAVSVPVDTPEADQAVAPLELSDAVEARTKVKKKGKSKEGDVVAEPASAGAEQPASKEVAMGEALSAEPVMRKRASKSKAAESVNDSHGPEAAVVPEASQPGPSSVAESATEPQQKEKKRKRRKTLAADTSVDPDTSTISSATVPEADVSQIEERSASVQSTSTAKKRGRKKSIAPSTSQATTSDSASAIAAVAAAVQAVLAKNKIAAAPPMPAPAPEQTAPESASEPVLPSRKRKAGKSKLRQAWGPEDISVDDQSSASIAPVVQEPDAVPTPTAPASSTPAEPIKAAPKVAKGKRSRPSSAPSCPICEKASLHPRAECPVVKGGPEFIRKRIAELKEGAHDEELVDELEVLLKEAQRRRKSAGSVPAPIQIPSPAATASEESTPSPVFPLNTASFAARPAPLPRVPAGSEISEVAVESKDEGSSNESSSDDDDDGDDEVVADALKPSSISFAPSSALGADLTSIDVEALLRGPVKPRGSILKQIPSSSSSSAAGGDSDEDAGQDEDVDLEEEEKNDRAFRRLSRKLQRAASSSDEEPELDAEVADVDARTDGEDAIVPPTTMDVQPNALAVEEPELEADVESSKRDITGDASAQEERGDESIPADAPEVKDATDQGYESDAEEAAPSESEAREADKAQDQEASGSESESEGEPALDEPSTHRGDGSPTKPTAEVDGSVHSSQEPPVQVDEGMEAVAAEPETAVEPPAEDEAVQEGEGDQTDAIEEVEHDAGAPAHDGSASEDEDEVEQDTALTASAARALSPELGEPEPQPRAEQDAEQDAGRTPSPPPLRQPEPVTDPADIDLPADGSPHMSSIDLHPDEGPSDPIESLGSFADVSERRRALEDDPIEDADAEGEPTQSSDPAVRAGTELARLQEGTPPPAVHRTPGTVSRMKDRYGRLGHGSPATLPGISKQLLDAFTSSQPADEVLNAEGAVEDTTPEQPEEDAPQQENAEADAEKAAAPEAALQQTQEEEADEPQELETRPRRTTRATRRTSAMTRSSSIPEPPASTPTPAPAPPSVASATTAPAAPKRRGRLTEEEKAAREAEKKAERERKAAEKKAEREAKAAEKKAEKEAKEAAKRAEKEAKEAAKQAAKEEAPKRGKGRATRGKTTAAKPVSTRSRAGASAEADEPAADAPAQEQEQEQDASGESSTPAATSTPGFSKVSWTTLPATQPRTQTESVPDVESSMVDELQPSSPSHSPEPVSRTTNTTEKDEADVSREVTITQDRAAEQEEYFDMPTMTPKPNGRVKEPLFIPSSSQFPNTPFPAGSFVESTPYANGRASGEENESEPERDAEGDRDEADGELPKPTKAKLRPRPWQADAPYRRLSDIASQQLFAGTQIPSPALFPASQSQPRKSSAAYGHRQEEDDDDDDSDEESSSGSDSDTGKKKSHIPQDRRAGAGVQKKKKTLLSFA